MDISEIQTALAAVDTNHFAIVESNQVMVYSTDSFYPTPIPVHKEARSYIPQRKCADCLHAKQLSAHEYACDAGKADMETLSCFSSKERY